MSEKKVKGAWQTSAEEIRMDTIDSQLYRSGKVNDFLVNKMFIVAEKGIGKTLLLKKKKYDLMESGDGIFVPSGSKSDLDISGDFGNFTKFQLSFLEDLKNTKTCWKLAIELSAIKAYNSCCEAIVDKKDVMCMTEDFAKLIESERVFEPGAIFRELVENIEKTMHSIKKCVSVVDAIYNRIYKTKVNIFIDSLDQKLDEAGCDKKMWINMQIGLIKAAWDLMRSNKWVKIFCSVRKEAYDSSVGSISANMDGAICVLTYGGAELHKLVNNLTQYYEDIETIEELAGFEKNGTFIHCLTGREETVFDYILRHTVERPRDLIRIASSLRDKVNKNENDKPKEEKLRDATLEIGCRIANEIFEEKVNFLGCIKNIYDKEDFLSRIPKNTLTREEVGDICKAYNKQEDGYCSDANCLKKGEVGACVHPFCELYNIGLFGYVDEDNCKQKFNDTNIKKELMTNSRFFVVHPSCVDIIREVRQREFKKAYVVTPGLVIGNGCEWKRRESQLTDLVSRILHKCDAVGERKGLKLRNELLDEIRTAPGTRLPCGGDDAGWVETLAKKVINTLEAVNLESSTNDVKLNSCGSDQKETHYKHTKRDLKKRTVFLSYCHKDNVVVACVEEALTSKNFGVKRDVWDLRSMDDVQKFMEALKEQDFAVLFLSDNYLQSQNCMLEARALFDEGKQDQKAYIVTLPGVEDMYIGTKSRKYVTYWEKKEEELVAELKTSYASGGVELITDELRCVRDIINVLPRFLKFVRRKKGTLFAELQRFGYIELLDYVSRKKRNSKKQ